MESKQIPRAQTMSSCLAGLFLTTLPPLPSQDRMGGPLGKFLYSAPKKKDQNKNMSPQTLPTPTILYAPSFHDVLPRKITLTAGANPALNALCAFFLRT